MKNLTFFLGQGIFLPLTWMILDVELARRLNFSIPEISSFSSSVMISVFAYLMILIWPHLLWVSLFLLARLRYSRLSVRYVVVLDAVFILIAYGLAVEFFRQYMDSTGWKMPNWYYSLLVPAQMLVAIVACWTLDKMFVGKRKHPVP